MVIALLLIIYLAFISLGLPDSLFGVAWPLMHIELGLDISFAPIISILMMICTAGVSFLAGPIIRKLGTERVVASSVLLTAIGMLGMSLANHVVLLFLCSVLLGIGAGTIDTALNDYVSKYYGSRHMSWLHGFWGIGVTISPLVMAVFLEQGGWRGGYTTMSYIQFALAGVMFLSLPLWKRVKKFKDAKRGEDSLSHEYKTNQAENAILTNIEGQDSDHKNKPKFNIFKEKGVVFSAIAFALYCGVEYSCGLWGASFLVQKYAFTPSVAAQFVALYYGGLMLGRFVTGAIINRLKRQTIIRIGLIVAIIGTILLAVPIPHMMRPAMLLIGVGLAPFFPTSLDLTKTRFNPKYSPDIIGIQMGSAYVGAFIIQTAVGYIASKVSWSIYPIMLILISVTILLAFEVVNRQTKNKS